MASPDALPILIEQVVQVEQEALQRLRSDTESEHVSHSSHLPDLISNINRHAAALERSKALLGIKEHVATMSNALHMDLAEVLHNHRHTFLDICEASSAARCGDDKDHVLVGSKYSLQSRTDIAHLRTQLHQCAVELDLIHATAWRSDVTEAQHEVKKLVKHDLGYLKASRVPGIYQCLEPILSRREFDALPAHINLAWSDGCEDFEEKNQGQKENAEDEHEEDNRSDKTMIPPEKASSQADSFDLPKKSVTWDLKSELHATVQELAPSPSSGAYKPQSVAWFENDTASLSGPQAWHGFHNPSLRGPSWTFEPSACHIFPSYEPDCEDLFDYLVHLDHSANAALCEHLETHGLKLLRLTVFIRHRFSPRLLFTGQQVKRMVILAEPIQAEEESNPPAKKKADTDKGNDRERQAIRDSVAMELMAALRARWTGTEPDLKGVDAMAALCEEEERALDSWRDRRWEAKNVRKMQGSLTGDRTMRRTLRSEKPKELVQLKTPCDAVGFKAAR